MRSPIAWYGGKIQMAKSIVSQFPPHTTFVDVFGGSAAILLAKEPSPVEVYNDIHSGLVTLFRVLRDPELFPRFERMCQLTPYSREEMEHCRASWQTEPDQVTKAWMFFVAVRQGFVGSHQGTKAAWSYAVGTSRQGRAKVVNAWLGVVDRLPEISARFKDVQVEYRDWASILADYDTPDTLFYCDPPYVPDTRVSTNDYLHEMDEPAHTALVERLLTIKGKAVLSGYDHALYAPLGRAGWDTRYTVRRSTAANYKTSKGHSMRTEVLWFNPAAQQATEVAS
jgi:DNA adenine methylase